MVFVSVYGSNGYGVMDSYERYFNNASIYLKNSGYQGCDTMEKAGKNAIEKFLALNVGNDLRFEIVEPGDMKMNTLIFRKNIVVGSWNDCKPALSEDNSKLVCPIRKTQENTIKHLK